MALVIVKFLLVCFLSRAFAVWLQSSLYRHQRKLLLYGDFTPYFNHHLVVTKLSSSLAEDQFDCTFKCIGEPKCFSFNMAAYPDSNGFYSCELLATDKYREKAKFHANLTFHHYSPWVSRQQFILPLFSLKETLSNFFTPEREVPFTRPTS